MSFPRVAVLGLLALLTACGTSDVGLAPETTTTTSTTVASSTSTSSTTSTSTTSTTTTTTTTTTVPEVLPELVFDETGVPVNGQTDGVLVSNTGWILPILSGLDDDRHRVWTPCGRQADIGGGRVISTADIVIDPGHGGSEPGAVGQGGLREADLNLDVAKKVRDAFVGAGYSVVMTRQTDVRVPIVTRAEIGQALDPIVFLSIHFNAGTDALSETPGTEMYHQIANPDSRRLAGLLYEETRLVLDQYDITWVALGDAGTTFRPSEEGGDYYGVLRRPAPVTSVLAEYAYLSNPAEEELVSDPVVQDQLATATLAAFERFLETDDPGTGFIDDPIFRGYGPSGAGRTDNCTDPRLE
ncbi:MAG: N-acetylmuramoyl-L-alanine amidase [Actinomycetota bacterium]